MKPIEPFDRSSEDVGNIVQIEHVNLAMPDQRIATIFYVSGLGLTRDPYLMTGVTNMWINAGRSQFHLPLNQPQRLRGRVGLVIPDSASLMQRLRSVRDLLAGTQFDFQEYPDHVSVTCPWGNTMRCHPHDPQKFDGMKLGIPYVEFDLPEGCAKSVVDFYQRIFAAPGRVEFAAENLLVARVSAGIGQELVFRETRMQVAPYDGHHIQVYVQDFSGPHQRLLERGLVTEESDQHQFRFSSIVNLETGADCLTIEHEVRSMRHPLFARPLVNRNPEQSNRNYARGKDALIS